MRSSRTNYVVVGSFVIVILAATITSLALLAGRTGATTSYYTTFENVMGVGRGTQVLFQGYRVGQVEGVERTRHDGGLGYRVELSVQRGLRIPEDSVASIAKGLLSAVTIDIQGGRSERDLEPGGTIRSRAAGDVFEAVSDVAGELQELTETSIRPLVDELARSVPEISGNLERFTEQLADTGARLNEVLAPENTRRIGRILENADAVTADFAVLVGELRETRALLDRVISEVDAIVGRNQGNVDRALLDLQHSLESVARHIDAVNENLEGTSRNMNEFSRRIRGNPALLLRSSPPPDDGDGAAPR